MKSEIRGGPTFAHIHVTLEPGEEIIGESDAMSSMAAELDLQAKLNGGFFGGLARKFLGGESLFVNHYKNNTNESLTLTLVQGTPGDVRALELDNDSICFQPGAYVASTPGVKLGLRWAGLASFLGREGLFKLELSGKGTVWYGAYGALVDHDVDGEYIVDTGHLVAYDPGMTLKVQLAGGLFGSLFGGEGLVTRVQGKGKITLQSRSLSGLAGWLNPNL